VGRNSGRGGQAAPAPVQGYCTQTERDRSQDYSTQKPPTRTNGRSRGHGKTSHRIPAAPSHAGSKRLPPAQCREKIERKPICRSRTKQQHGGVMGGNRRWVAKPSRALRGGSVQKLVLIGGPGNHKSGSSGISPEHRAPIPGPWGLCPHKYAWRVEFFGNGSMAVGTCQRTPGQFPAHHDKAA